MGRRGTLEVAGRQLHICNLYVVYRAIKINYTKLKTYVQQEEKWLMDAQRNRRIEASGASVASKVSEANRRSEQDRNDQST